MSGVSVPDLPAVKLALERLNELGKQLIAERVPFSQEASHALVQISQAVEHLEASRRAAREQLEVQTIETSKLRHQVLQQRCDIIREISAAAAAAREEGVAERSRLRQELSEVERELELTQQKQKHLEEESARLLPERDLLRSERGQLLRRLNLQLSEKADLQIQSGGVREEIRSVEEEIRLTRENEERLEEEMVRHRATFTQSRALLEAEMEARASELREQKKRNAEKSEELEALTATLEEKEENAQQYSQHLQLLERSVDELGVAEQKLHTRLEAGARTSRRLCEHREAREQELRELEEARGRRTLQLKENIAQVEAELEAARELNGALTRSLAELSQTLSEQREEEAQATEEHHALTRRLERSKQMLDEGVVAAARRQLETKEMKAEIKRIQESKVNAELLQKDIKDLEEKLSSAKKNRAELETHEDEQRLSLETLREREEQSEDELRSALALMESSQRHLQDQEKQLLQENGDLDALMEELTQKISRAEEENREMKIKYEEEIKQLRLEEDSMAQAQQEKESELEEKRRALLEVEVQREAELSRHRRLRRRETELQEKGDLLRSSIQHTEERTAELLRSKEEVQEELRLLSEQHLEALSSRAQQVFLTERNVYEEAQRLERVGMENGRLHLCVEQMKEEMRELMLEKMKHTQETQQLTERIQPLHGCLLDDWMVNKVATEEACEGERGLLGEMRSLLLRVTLRRGHVEEVNRRLEKELRDVMERLEKLSL